MSDSKTRRLRNQKRQFTVLATSEVLALVTKITNKYSRAVVAMHPTDEEGPMDAGLSDCALFTSALHSLDERLDANDPSLIVTYIDRFKKKRGPQLDRNGEEMEKGPPFRKGEVTATPIDADASKKRNLVLSKKS